MCEVEAFLLRPDLGVVGVAEHGYVLVIFRKVGTDDILAGERWRRLPTLSLV